MQKTNSKTKNLNKRNLWLRVIEDLKLLFALIKDYCLGKYRKIPYSSVIIIIFTLLYVLSPIDFISDFIPGLGQIDDTALIFICLYLIETDLYKYRDWKMEQTS